MLEVINGITFLTPLWLRLPRVALIHHVHREHYAQELGRLGKIAAFLLETAPLRWLYTGSRFQTLSHAEAEKIAEHGIPLEAIDVNYIGVELDAFAPRRARARADAALPRPAEEVQADRAAARVLETVPGAVLDIAGEGDHRPDLEAEIERRGLERPGADARPRERGAQARAAAARVGEPDRVVGRGLVPDRDGGRRLRARRRPRWPSAACPSRSTTAAPARSPRDAHELGEKVRAIVADPAERDRLGQAALERARTFTWDAAAQRSLDALEAARAEAPEAEPLRDQFARSDTGRAAGLAAAVMAANVVALIFTVAFARILGTSGYGTLAALVSTFLILQVPGSALQITVAREVSTAIALGHEAPGAGVRRWLGRIAILTLAVTVVADPAARPARRGDRRRRGVGRRGHAPDGLPVAARLGRARRAPGVPALPRRRPVARRRGLRAARCSACCSWRSGWA